MKTATKNVIKFDQAMKLFKKFVATEDYRPILKLVHFDGKYLVSTNSHVLLRVNAEHITDLPELELGSLIDPKTNTVIADKMNYPQTERLIPSHYNTKATIDGNIKEFQTHVKAAKSLVKNKHNKVIKLELTRQETTLTAKYLQDDDTLNEYKETMKNLYVSDEELTLHVSAKYLDDTLTTIKKLSKLSSNPVELQIISSVRPILFTQENVFDIIVLPLKVY